MITPKAVITIAASPRQVITFLADPINAPRWMKALEVRNWSHPDRSVRDHVFREIQNAGGARIETICEVVEYDGATRYAWKSVSEGPAHYGGGFTAVSIEGGTELR